MNMLNILKYIVSKPSTPSIIYSHKARYTFEERSNDSCHIYDILKKIPLILEKEESSNLPEIEINNYVLPKNITVGEFMVYLRKKCFNLNKENMFIFISKSNYVPKLEEKMSDLYEKFKDNDGFIYCKYTTKN